MISLALADSEPFITTALAMLPPKRPKVARAGCVIETQSNNEHITRPLDGLPSLVPFSVFATDIFPKLHANISERVNLLRFAKLASVFSNRARPESRCFPSKLHYGALSYLASDPPATGRLSELRLSETSPLTLQHRLLRRGMSHRRYTIFPHPLHSTLPHRLCSVQSPGSSYAGCIRVGGCRHVE
jgi:hypothetical protein